MKRDISTLIEQSTQRRDIKGCPFVGLDGAVGEYVAALEQIDRGNLNKAAIRKILIEEFKVTIPEKRIYDHFRPNRDCEC